MSCRYVRVFFTLNRGFLCRSDYQLKRRVSVVFIIVVIIIRAIYPFLSTEYGHRRLREAMS